MDKRRWSERKATAVEAGEKGLSVAPWYDERLAVIHRRQNRLSDEMAILERYARQPKAPGAMPAKLSKRLERAQELVARASPRDA